VAKVTAGEIAVRATWYTQPPPKNSNQNHYGNWGRGTSGRNNQAMHQHMVMMQQQLSRQRRSKTVSTKPTEHHQDYTMDFASDATARVKHYPPKVKADGKKGVCTPEEYQKMKGNPLLPGWKAELSEVKVGQLVEAIIVRLSGSHYRVGTPDRGVDEESEYQ